MSKEYISPPERDSGVVTNLQVQQFVQWSLNKADGRTYPEKIADAWEWANGWRHTHCGYGLHAVAAERYLYARMLAHSYLRFIPIAAIGEIGVEWWDKPKTFAKKHGENLNESHCPTSHPSPWVRAWGVTGVYDGLRDSDKLIGTPRAPALPNKYGQALPHAQPEEADNQLVQ
jgi:hypothetical protein